MSHQLNINGKLAFIGGFELLSSLLDTLVKNLGKGNFKSKEFDIKILDLVKQKGFYPYEYISSYEKFKRVSKQRKVL